MKPVSIELTVVPADEIKELQDRCAALEAANQSLVAQMEALRCRYSEVLIAFGDLKRSLR